MSITVGTVLKVVAVMSWLDGDIAQNVFSAVISGTGGPYDDADIVADALAWLEAMYLPLAPVLSDELDGSEVRVYEYDDVDEDYDEVGSDSWVFNPAQATDQLPRGNSMLLNCKTLDPDVNGKKYLPGMCDGLIVNGLITAGVISDLVDFSDEWVAPFVGATSTADWVPGVWSTKNLNFFAMSGTVLIPSIVAYQRRRKRGVGI